MSRPVPEGVDERERNTQLVVLWLGMPLAVLALCGIVMLLAVLVAATLLNASIPH
jgi:hypothetical protein